MAWRFCGPSVSYINVDWLVVAGILRAGEGRLCLILDGIQRMTVSSWIV
jgi:hypothetical protein